MMNNFKFYILGNYSPNIRTFGKCKSTCYMLEGFSQHIFLDFGAGVFSKFIRMVNEGKIDLSKVLIIISHNHVDHNLSLLSLAIYLYIYNLTHKKKIVIDIVLPHKSIVYNIVNKFKGVFNIHVLNEKFMMKIDEAKFTFCKTIHRGESYATKIQIKDKWFVYTSDIARYSDELKDFVWGSESVLIDAGYPKKRFNSFRNYHGRTKDILKDTSKLNVKKIYASHIRFFSNYKDYKNYFPKYVKTQLVKIDNTYKMFK